MKKEKANMTDKEKLLKVLEYCDGSFEQIMLEYLASNHKDFSAQRLCNLISDLSKGQLCSKIIALENIKYISRERATYLKTYLEGNMYATKEDAIAHVPVQIENAKVIIKACE